MPKDATTVRPRELLVELELEEFDLILREIWLKYFGHVQLFSGAFSQHVIYTLMEGAGKRGGDDMETNDRERLHERKLNVQQSIPSKGTTSDQVEIFYSCS